MTDIMDDDNDKQSDYSDFPDENESFSDNNDTEDEEDEEEYEQIIIKSNKNVLNDSERLSLNKLTKYEYTSLICARIQQLSQGATPLVDINDCYNDIIKIAQKELKENKIPFQIKRPVDSNKYEIWKLNELINTFN